MQTQLVCAPATSTCSCHSFQIHFCSWTHRRSGTHQGLSSRVVSAQAVLAQGARIPSWYQSPASCPDSSQGSVPRLPCNLTAPWPPSSTCARKEQPVTSEEGARCLELWLWGQSGPVGAVIPFALFDGELRGSREEQAGGKTEIDKSCRNPSFQFKIVFQAQTQIHLSSLRT